MDVGPDVILNSVDCLLAVNSSVIVDAVFDLMAAEGGVRPPFMFSMYVRECLLRRDRCNCIHTSAPLIHFLGSDVPAHV